MSTVMDEELKRWTARRKSALMLEISQGKTTVAEAARQYDLQPSARGRLRLVSSRAYAAARRIGAMRSPPTFICM